MGMAINVDVDTVAGAPLRALIHGTIHRMPKAQR
jgi:hypothetical protein